MMCVCVCVNCCRLIYRYIAYRDTYSLCVWFFCIYLAGTIKPTALLSGVEVSLKPGVITNSWVYQRPEISTPYFAPEQIGFEIIIFCKTDLQKYHLLWFRKKSRTRHPSSHPHLVPMALSPHHAPILQQLSLEPRTFDPGNGLHDPCYLVFTSNRIPTQVLHHIGNDSLGMSTKAVA